MPYVPPSTKCHNCGQKEWLESPELGYIPRLEKDSEGRYMADTNNGVHLRVWRCNNCMYIMTFWEPD